MTTAKVDTAEFQALHEIVAAAHKALDRNLWDYIAGGTETETTVARNRLALDCIAFRPRVLNDVSKITTGKTFLGHEVRLPVMLAPVGGLASIREDGNIMVARAATAYGVPYILSSVNAVGLETVAAAAPGPKLFPLYTRGDDSFVDEMTDVIVGLHMIGPDAPEILQAAAIAVKAKLTKADFDATFALHPTMAEELVLMK